MHALHFLRFIWGNSLQILMYETMIYLSWKDQIILGHLYIFILNITFMICAHGHSSPLQCLLWWTYLCSFGLTRGESVCQTHDSLPWTKLSILIQWGKLSLRHTDTQTRVVLPESLVFFKHCRCEFQNHSQTLSMTFVCLLWLSYTIPGILNLPFSVYIAIHFQRLSVKIAVIPKKVKAMLLLNPLN